MYTANTAIEIKVLGVLDRLLFWELGIIDQDIWPWEKVFTKE